MADDNSVPSRSSAHDDTESVEQGDTRSADGGGQLAQRPDVDKARSPLSLFHKLKHIRSAANGAIDDAIQLVALADRSQPVKLKHHRNTTKHRSKQRETDVNSVPVQQESDEEQEEQEEAGTNSDESPTRRRLKRSKKKHDVDEEDQDEEEEEEDTFTKEQKRHHEQIAMLGDTVSGLTGIPPEQIFPDQAPPAYYDSSTTSASGLHLHVLAPIANAALNDIMAYVKRSGSAEVKHKSLWDLLDNTQLAVQLAKTVAYYIIANNTRFGKHWYRAEQRKEAADRYSQACLYWSVAQLNIT